MIDSAWSLAGLGPAPSNAAGGYDPFSMFASWDGDQLLWLAVLVPIAVLVFFVGSRRLRSQLGSSAITPRGRDRFVAGGHRRDAAWRTTVERLEQRIPTPIAQASGGTVRIEATIVSASGNLGGTPGRECVWRNRAGAGPQTAVGADLVIVADDSGRCGIEELEGARVVAPTDKAGAHYESTSLHVGDRIEVIATFEREVVGEHEDPAQLVYGTLGSDGRVDVRVLDRPTAEEAEPESAKPESSEPESSEPESAEPESAEPESSEPESAEPAP